MENRLDWALGHAGLTVDALVGVDVDHLVPLVEALDGAHHDAVGVLAGKTGLGDDVGHDRVISRRWKCGGKAGRLRGMVGRTPNPVNETNRLFLGCSVSRDGLRLEGGNGRRMIGGRGGPGQAGRLEASP